MELPRRWTDRVSVGILVSLLVVLGIGYLQAQGQVALLTPTGVEAVLSTRIDGMITRVEHLEHMSDYALLAIVGNLLAHLFQISANRGRRGG